ncbi:MAG: tRNA (cytidine(34)-2'-O)-methyltransferase [Planctomycetota bacterium]|nr:tRNA (cytidine(34)-2'-O)-methyltransferase [Planctomycetota bacterium]
MKYEPNFHVVLHEPEIPQNTGNIGRTCVATAAKLWLIKPLGFSMEERMVRRAGLDYWPHLEWEIAGNWDDAVRHLPDRRPWYFSKKATHLYTDVAFERGDVFVFGCETQGLPDSMIDANRDRCLRIPIREQVRSLNLANAVAVTLFEAMRQINLIT